MIDVILLLGGNLGNMPKNISDASNEIDSRIGEITNRSKIYESEAWGFSGNSFHNQVMVCKTKLAPEKLLEEIWAIEHLFGRERGSKEQELEKYTNRKDGKIGYSDRSIDIDILYYGDEVIQTPLLTIPHPLISSREFVLIPLNELFEQTIFPQQTLSIQQLLHHR